MFTFGLLPIKGRPLNFTLVERLFNNLFDLPFAAQEQIDFCLSQSVANVRGQVLMLCEFHLVTRLEAVFDQPLEHRLGDDKAWAATALLPILEGSFADLEFDGRRVAAKIFCFAPSEEPGGEVWFLLCHE